MTDVILLGLNDIGETVTEWLRERDGVTVQAVIETESGLGRVADAEPDVIVSAGYRHIVPEEILEIPSLGAVNLHKSYLPYNRGANPNVWTIVDDTPAGVSIHYMTSDVDAGPIIDRREVPTYPDDNGKDLYQRLEAAQERQFKDVWPDIASGDVEAIEQAPDAGTYHRKSEFVDLWELDRDEQVRVGDLIDRLRALTFPPFDNAYFEKDGTKYHVEIEITPEDADEDATTDEETRTDGDRPSVPTYNEEER